MRTSLHLISFSVRSVTRTWNARNAAGTYGRHFSQAVPEVIGLNAPESIELSYVLDMLIFRLDTGASRYNGLICYTEKKAQTTAV